jgi:TctA family transporter
MQSSTLIVVLFLVSIVFWGWMFVDCLKTVPSENKLRWVLLFVFTGFIGAVIYFFRRPPKDVYIEYRPETGNEFLNDDRLIEL